MGTTQSKKEEIIIETSGTGNNQSSQSMEITRGEWMLIGVFIVMGVILAAYGVKKLKSSLKSIVRQEIRLHELRKSQPQLQLQPQMEDARE